VAPLDEVLGLGGDLVALAGERADVRVELASSPTREPLELSMRGERAHVEVDGSLSGSPFSWEALLSELDFEASVSGIPAPVLFGAFGLRPEGEEGPRLDWSRSEDPVRIVYEGWRRRAEPLAADPAPPGPPGMIGDGRGRGESGSLSIDVPRLSVLDPDLAEHGLELLLSDVGFSASGDADSLRIDVTADFERGDGRIEEIWTLYGLDGPFGLDGWEDAVLSAMITSAPTALVDAKLGTGGLLADVFGPTLGLEFRGSGLTTTGGRFQLEAAGARGMATLHGFHERGVRVSSADLTLSSELNEASFERLVRPLLPFVESARPEAPGDTFSLRLEDGVLPLDGRAAALAGRGVLDLAPARLALSRDLLAFLVGGSDSWEPVPATDALAFALEGGRVLVDGLELPLDEPDERHGGGLVLPLTGSYGIGGTAIDVQTELPLHAIGPDVSPILVGLRDLLSPNLDVPIVVTGEPGALDLAVRPQWIKTVNDVLAGMVPDVVKENLKRLLAESEE
jgi:hypothetical protein